MAPTERVRVLEGLGNTPGIVDDMRRALDVGAPLGTDVSRQVARLATGYRWASGDHLVRFAACARPALSGCLAATPPEATRIDPAFRSALLGLGGGVALAAGRGIIAGALAVAWLYGGRSLL